MIEWWLFCGIKVLKSFERMFRRIKMTFGWWTKVWNFSKRKRFLYRERERK